MNVPAGSPAPLGGVRVLDFTRVAAGPYLTMLLADMGAEIVKIERPETGDEVRAMGRPLPGGDEGESDYYVALNRSKRSVALDLTNPSGVDVARRLAERSDIVVENFRPGVAARLGIGFKVLAARRRCLVYTSITGFGRSGPWAQRPANDIMMQSVSGLMGVTGEVGGAPVRLGTSISDFASGLFGLAGTLAAFAAREMHPDGQHVEIPMLDASIALLPNLIPMASRGTKIERIGRGHPQILGYASFEAADGAFVTVGAFSEVFWRRLCVVVGHEEWLDDPRLASNGLRVQQRHLLDSALEEAFRRRTAAEWCEVLEEADIPYAPVLELHEALASKQAKVNGVVWWLRHGDQEIGTVRNPIQSAQWGDYTPGPAPGLGADTRAVLADVLGMEKTDVDEVARRGGVVLPNTP